MGFFGIPMPIFPVGWSAYSVTPNVLDHLLFVPFNRFRFLWQTTYGGSVTCGSLLYVHTFTEERYQKSFCWMDGWCNTIPL